MLASVDGTLIEATEAQLSVADPGLLRGDGAFEVIRLYRGRPWALDEHLGRMASSAEKLRLPFSSADFVADIAQLLAAGEQPRAFLRLVATRGGRRICILEPVPTGAAGVATLATIPYDPPKLMIGVKSLSYATNMLAERLAREQGADDALFVTSDGIVLEATRASVFYTLHDGALHTPPLTLILDSITRRHLLTVTGATERDLRTSELADVQEMFIASTTKEVLPIACVDRRPLPVVGGARTRGAEDSLRARIAERLGLDALD